MRNSPYSDSEVNVLSKHSVTCTGEPSLCIALVSARLVCAVRTLPSFMDFVKMAPLSETALLESQIEPERVITN